MTAHKRHSGVPGHDPRFTHNAAMGGSPYDKNLHSNPATVGAPTLPDDWDDGDDAVFGTSFGSTQGYSSSGPVFGADPATGHSGEQVEGRHEAQSDDGGANATDPEQVDPAGTNPEGGDDGSGTE